MKTCMFLGILSREGTSGSGRREKKRMGRRMSTFRRVFKPNALTNSIPPASCLATLIRKQVATSGSIHANGLLVEYKLQRTMRAQVCRV